MVGEGLYWNSPSGQGLLQGMVEKRTFGLALETQATGRQVGVTLPPEAAAPLTGGQQTCQVSFGDDRGVEVHGCVVLRGPGACINKDMCALVAQPCIKIREPEQTLLRPQSSHL